MSIRGLFTSSRRQRIGSFVLAVALAALSLPKAWAADNPYNLIDPKTISVGTMGDAKPYMPSPRPTASSPASISNSS